MGLLRLRWLAAAILAGLAAACAVTPAPRPGGANQAAQLESRGQYQAAAEAWLAAATSAREPAAAATNRLNAARDFARANLPGRAWQAIAPAEIGALPAQERIDGAETKARIALAVHRPNAALAALAAVPAPSAPQDRLRFLALRGQAQFAAGNSAAGLETLVARGRLAAASNETLANDELIWDQLTDTPNLPSGQGLSQTAQGWIALAHIWRTSWEIPGEFSARLADWRTAYPQHPAGQGLLAQIEAEEKAQLSYPAKIALLLPVSGPYAQQAVAVEAGLLDAYYRSADPLPAITVYDTGGTGSGARAAAVAAQSAGADFVIGPLTVAGVSGAASADPQIPILALNYLNAPAASPRFFQFGLSPAQEAEASAEQAVSDGFTRAVVLVSGTDSGKQIADSFTRAFVDLGGQTLATVTFREGTEDFDAPLSALFGLDASEAREQRLAALLGQPLGFEPRRRRDIQFVFFSASYDTARLIVPQISYYQGLGLPVFSTSAVFRPGTGTADFDGVRFPIMPWFAADSGPVAAMRESVHRLFPDGWSQLAPLYALGYDAWRLVPMLANSPHPLQRPVRGVTGLLSLGPGNVVQRRPDWARYANGEVKTVATPPSP